MKKPEIKKNLNKILAIFRDQFPDEEGVQLINKLLEKVEKLPADQLKNTDEISGNFSLPLELENQKSGFAIFSDGACRGNPGPGSWAVIIQNHKGEFVLKSSGVDIPTTNNKMELEGVIRGLRGLMDKFVEEGFSQSSEPVFVYSDSKYVIEGIEKWVPGWKNRGWKKADNKTPENLEQWKELDALKHNFENLNFHWVKGHAGHPQNELCDQMCNTALDEAGF
jgi:ribonuclease HI